ncbi:universal stress protein [Methylobacterium sp. CM6257]|jgi:nucleotide-binding universal stress UspA family protein
MISNLRNILICVTEQLGTEASSDALAYGLSLAAQAGARLTVQAASVKLVLPHAWISRLVHELVADENRRLRALAERMAEQARGNAAAVGVVCTTETPHLAYSDLLNAFRWQARLHDLAVIDAEPDAMTGDRGLIEVLLFDSGRPQIVVPRGGAFAARRILVAWDGSAQATRALHDALPFLKQADAVEIVSVVGEKDLSESLPGAEIAPSLAHHDVPVTVVDLVAEDGDVAETLRKHATLSCADMIVMGAFVHSRLRELVWGGVTQALLRSCPVPLFLSR